MPDFTDQFLYGFAEKSDTPFRVTDHNHDPWDYGTSDAAARISPSYESWKEVTLAAFKKLASTTAGMALLQARQATQKWVLLMPPSLYSCNAFGASSHFFLGGHEYFAKLAFDPHAFMSGSACYQRNRLGDPRYNRGAFPDEVLFHEMVHNLRATTDKGREQDLGGGLKRYNTLEEFYAVLLTNIYISDATNRHSSGLRVDHVQHTSLEKELSGSFTFYQSSPQTVPLIDQLVNDHHDFCKKLSKVKASFNPLAAYFQNYHAIKAMSLSSLSRHREATIPRLPFPITQPADLPSGTLAKILADDALSVLNMLRR